MITPPRKRNKQEQPEATEQEVPEHVDRDDYLEQDALDAHGHGEQPEREREADLTANPAAHQI